MMFGRYPVNATTLAARLEKFWPLKEPSPVLVAYAVRSCKKLDAETPIQPSKIRLVRFRTPPSRDELLSRLYKHGPLLRVLDSSEVFRAVFCDQPKPSIQQLPSLLLHSRKGHLPALRSELARGNTVNAFKVIDLAPAKLSPRPILPITLASLGLLQALLWWHTWVVATSLFALYAGLSVSSFPVNHYCVEWRPSMPLSSRNPLKLEMAHMIVTSHDERSHNLRTFHRTQSASNRSDLRIRHLLHRRGLRRRHTLSTPVEDIYADYWSNPAKGDWQWVEPDQDPVYMKQQ